MARYIASLFVGFSLFLGVSSFAEDYVAPRLSGTDKPDLNGVWQALNSANYNIEMHTASHSMQLREGPHGPLPAVKTLYLGAVGAVPPGLGICLLDTSPSPRDS